jgi:DDE superfamily endonuclease
MRRSGSSWRTHIRPLPAGRAQGYEIQWADETGLSNQANYGRSFAPRGQTPVIRRPARRVSQAMISSLTNQGKLRFMIYEGALNTTIFLNFLHRLVREAARKLFVIVGNLPVHRARRVTAWVQDHADQIKLVYLPPPAFGAGFMPPSTIPTNASITTPSRRWRAVVRQRTRRRSSPA